MNIKIAFEAEKLPFYCVSLKDGRKTLEMQAFDNILAVSVQYDYDRKPLELNGEIKEGDRVEIILLAHRIELHINGVLVDEEWPAGNRFFEVGDGFFPSADICVSEYQYEEKEQPCVLSSFDEAEGWYPGGGVFVGDCMPYDKDGEYHVLYLKDRHHHKSKWNLGAHQWDHISTKDFKTWDVRSLIRPKARFARARGYGMAAGNISIMPSEWARGFPHRFGEACRRTAITSRRTRISASRFRRRNTTIGAREIPRSLEVRTDFFICSSQRAFERKTEAVLPISFRRIWRNGRTRATRSMFLRPRISPNVPIILNIEANII